MPDLAPLDLSDLPATVKRLRELNLSARLQLHAERLRRAGEPVTLERLSAALESGEAALRLVPPLAIAPAALRTLAQEPSIGKRIDAALAEGRPVYDRLAAAALDLF